NGQGSRRDFGEPLLELGVIEVAAQHVEPRRLNPLGLEIGRQGSRDRATLAWVAQVDRGRAGGGEVEAAETGNRPAECDRVVRWPLRCLTEIGLWRRSRGAGRLGLVLTCARNDHCRDQ